MPGPNGQECNKCYWQETSGIDFSDRIFNGMYVVDAPDSGWPMTIGSW